jgi:hypothetical protein
MMSGSFSGLQSFKHVHVSSTDLSPLPSNHTFSISSPISGSHPKGIAQQRGGSWWMKSAGSTKGQQERLGLAAGETGKQRGNVEMHGGGRRHIGDYADMLMVGCYSTNYDLVLVVY